MAVRFKTFTNATWFFVPQEVRYALSNIYPAKGAYAIYPDGKFIVIAGGKPDKITLTGDFDEDVAVIKQNAIIKKRYENVVVFEHLENNKWLAAKPLKPDNKDRIANKLEKAGEKLISADELNLTQLATAVLSWGYVFGGRVENEIYFPETVPVLRNNRIERTPIKEAMQAYTKNGVAYAINDELIATCKFITKDGVTAHVDDAEEAEPAFVPLAFIRRIGEIPENDNYVPKFEGKIIGEKAWWLLTTKKEMIQLSEPWVEAYDFTAVILPKTSEGFKQLLKKAAAAHTNVAFVVAGKTKMALIIVTTAPDDYNHSLRKAQKINSAIHPGYVAPKRTDKIQQILEV